MSRKAKRLARRGPRRGVSLDGFPLVAILLIAMLVAATPAPAERSSKAPPPSTGETHGIASDETAADHPVGPPEEAPVEKSGSSAPERHVRPAEPRQRELLPLIILKSIERPFMMPPK